MRRPVPALLATAALLVLVPGAAQAATADPAGPGCDRLDDAACLLPFPNDRFTRPDARTDTGRRLAFRSWQTPRNAQGTPIDPEPLNAFDGFSPGSVILTKYREREAPVLVLDARTGERHPIWAELDSNASTDTARLLQIHPAINFREGRRYVVVLRS